MTDHADTLVALAEIATGLAGFSGILVVLGNVGTWSDQQKLAIWALLQSSLGAIVLSLIPLLLLEGIEDSVVAWRIATAILLAFSVLGYFSDLPYVGYLAGIIWLLCVAIIWFGSTFRIIIERGT